MATETMAMYMESRRYERNARRRMLGLRLAVLDEGRQ